MPTSSFWRALQLVLYFALAFSMLGSVVMVFFQNSAASVAISQRLIDASRPEPTPLVTKEVKERYLDFIFPRGTTDFTPVFKLPSIRLLTAHKNDCCPVKQNDLATMTIQQFMREVDKNNIGLKPLKCKWSAMQRVTVENSLKTPDIKNSLAENLVETCIKEGADTMKSILHGFKRAILNTSILFPQFAAENEAALKKDNVGELVFSSALRPSKILKMSNPNGFKEVEETESDTVDWAEFQYSWFNIVDTFIKDFDKIEELAIKTFYLRARSFCRKDTIWASTSPYKHSVLDSKNDLKKIVSEFFIRERLLLAMTFRSVDHVSSRILGQVGEANVNEMLSECGTYLECCTLNQILNFTDEFLMMTDEHLWGLQNSALCDLLK